MQNSRFKLLIENVFVYGFGGIISKIIPIIMLPIITRLIPNTKYYGLADLSNLVVTFLTAIAIMGMYDAMFRTFFDKDDNDYKIRVVSTTLRFVSINSIIIFVFIVIFRTEISKLVFGDSIYSSLLLVTASSIIVSTLSTVISAPTKFQNKRKVFLITNTIAPIISYSISIPLIINGVYLFALPIAGLLSSSILLISFFTLNRKWFNFHIFDKSLLKSMLKIGLPLIPTFLIYWIFQSFDRIMITQLLDSAQTGIYSVGARVASISQVLYMAFAAGWQYFAFSTMNDEDQIKITSRIFSYVFVISFIVFAIFAPFSRYIFEIIFEGEYVYGNVVFPYLLVSPLLLISFQIISNQFLVVKNTLPATLILSVGAIVNVILNYFLIKLYGIEGAAISTLFGYFLSVGIACVVLQKMKLIHINKKIISTYLAYMIYVPIWRIFAYNSIWFSVLLTTVSTLTLIIIFGNDIIELKDKTIRLVKSYRKEG